MLCSVEAIARRIDSSTLQIIEEDAAILKNLEVGELKIRTKKPIAVREFSRVRGLGRFVFVRDENICAGGIITKLP
jgi:sulfate adenylyltransferase subunit 1 (EFTu-like GTPase family)